MPQVCVAFVMIAVRIIRTDTLFVLPFCMTVARGFVNSKIGQSLSLDSIFRAWLLSTFCPGTCLVQCLSKTLRHNSGACLHHVEAQAPVSGHIIMTIPMPICAGSIQL